MILRRGSINYCVAFPIFFPLIYFFCRERIFNQAQTMCVQIEDIMLDCLVHKSVNLRQTENNNDPRTINSLLTIGQKCNAKREDWHVSVLIFLCFFFFESPALTESVQTCVLIEVP